MTNVVVTVAGTSVHAGHSRAGQVSAASVTVETAAVLLVVVVTAAGILDADDQHPQQWSRYSVQRSGQHDAEHDGDHDARHGGRYGGWHTSAW